MKENTQEEMMNGVYPDNVPTEKISMMKKTM
jgi:hypothetical protein